MPEDALQDFGLDAAISSIEVFSSGLVFSNVILFSNRLPGFISLALQDYQGDFRHVASPTTVAEVFANLTDHGFNDTTRSLLLVNTSRAPEFRVSFRDAFLEQWTQTPHAELGADASRKSDPLMTWEAFPRGVSYLDENQIYLKIHQGLNINLDWWPDYDASVTYHIHLYLDSGRHLLRSAVGSVGRGRHQVREDIRPPLAQGGDGQGHGQPPVGRPPGRATEAPGLLLPTGPATGPRLGR